MNIVNLQFIITTCIYSHMICDEFMITVIFLCESLTELLFKGSIANISGTHSKFYRAKLSGETKKVLGKEFM